MLSWSAGIDSSVIMNVAYPLPHFSFPCKLREHQTFGNIRFCGGRHYHFFSASYFVVANTTYRAQFLPPYGRCGSKAVRRSII